jgi:hypothetical protein
MRRLFVALFLAASASTAGAQNWLAAPVMRSCEAFMKCEVGLGKLSAANRLKFEQALKVVRPKATVEEISERLGAKPFYEGAPLDVGGGVKTHKVMWSLATPPAKQSAEHIDVLFYNGKAVLLRWYERGAFKESADAKFAE